MQETLLQKILGSKNFKGVEEMLDQSKFASTEGTVMDGAILGRESFFRIQTLGYPIVPMESLSADFYCHDPNPRKLGSEEVKGFLKRMGAIFHYEGALAVRQGDSVKVWYTLPTNFRPVDPFLVRGIRMDTGGTDGSKGVMYYLDHEFRL